MMTAATEVGHPATPTHTRIRKVVTVPRGPNATAEAIEESGLVNIHSTGTIAVAECSYTFAIVGYEPTDTMTLAIELSQAGYIAVMDSLHEAVIAFGGYHTRSNRERSVHALELEHLRTLLAEAAAPKEQR